MNVIVSPGILPSPKMTPVQIQEYAKKLFDKESKRYNARTPIVGYYDEVDSDEMKEVKNKIKDAIVESKTLELIPCAVICYDENKLKKLVKEVQSLGGNFNEYKRSLRRMESGYYRKEVYGAIGEAHRYEKNPTSIFSVILIGDDRKPDRMLEMGWDRYHIATFHLDSIEILESEFRTMF